MTHWREGGIEYCECGAVISEDNPADPQGGCAACNRAADDEIDRWKIDKHDD